MQILLALQHFTWGRGTLTLPTFSLETEKGVSRSLLWRKNQPWFLYRNYRQIFAWRLSMIWKFTVQNLV